MGEPAFHLDSDLNPIGMSMGCSSRLGPPFLGSDGTFLLCGLSEGHAGRHLFHAEWDDEAALIEHPGRRGDSGSHDARYRECQGCGMEWFEGDPYAPEKHLSTCPIGPHNGSEAQS